MAFADLTSIDVTGWPEAQHEQRGKRSKVWLTCPEDSTSWLRKSVSEKPPRAYENWIEAFALELARISGIESAYARPCTWRDGSQWRHGLLSREFVKQGELLSSGAELLSLFIAPELERGIRFEHAYSLDLVLRCIPAFERHPPTGYALLRVLAFDAWVGNGDRHSENWSVILSFQTKGLRLAPMYDPAACLGSELQDAQVDALVSDENRLEKYVRNCPSGFGDGRSKILLMSQVVERLVAVPTWRSNMTTWLGEFRTALEQLKDELAAGVSWLPESRQTLALRLLEARLRWLAESTRCA
jgi:HipA-like C-terminal domain